MAELKQNVIGNLNGKLGNLVFRQLNGKNFISFRPEKYKPTKSKNAKNVRSGFSQIILFASTINKNPILKSIWQKSKIDASNSYTKIIKANLKISPREGIRKLNIIVPESNISLESNLEFSENILKISYDQNTIYKSFKSGVELNCCILLFFSEPKDTTSEIHCSTLLTSQNYSFLENKIIFSFTDFAVQHYKKILFFHSIVSNKNLEDIKWSSTISGEIIF